MSSGVQALWWLWHHRQEQIYEYQQRDQSLNKVNETKIKTNHQLVKYDDDSVSTGPSYKPCVPEYASFIKGWQLYKYVQQCMSDVNLSMLNLYKGWLNYTLQICNNNLTLTFQC